MKIVAVLQLFSHICFRSPSDRLERCHYRVGCFLTHLGLVQAAWKNYGQHAVCDCGTSTNVHRLPLTNHPLVKVALSRSACPNNYWRDFNRLKPVFLLFLKNPSWPDPIGHSGSSDKYDTRWLTKRYQVYSRVHMAHTHSHSAAGFFCDVLIP